MNPNNVRKILNLIRKDINMKKSVEKIIERVDARIEESYQILIRVESYIKLRRKNNKTVENGMILANLYNYHLKFARDLKEELEIVRLKFI